MNNSLSVTFISTMFRFPVTAPITEFIFCSWIFNDVSKGEEVFQCGMRRKNKEIYDIVILYPAS
jgi:hypothetical protein